MNWRDAMHGLAEIGFDGLLNFELSTGRIPPALRPAYAAYVRAAATELLTYIE